MTLTAAQLAHLSRRHPTPVGKGRHPRERTRDRMSKTERRYDEHLAALRAAGQIAWYAYEPWILRLAPDTSYRVDFGVLTASGDLEVHEVKGYRRPRGDAPGARRFYATEDAWLKVKLVAEIHPFRVLVTWQEPDGHWRREVIG